MPLKRTQKDICYKLFPKTGGSTGFKKHETKEDGRHYIQIEGCVRTRFTIVKCYASKHEGRHQASMIEIVKDGMMHTRFFNRFITQRGLVTKAKEYAEELFTSQECRSKRK